MLPVCACALCLNVTELPAGLIINDCCVAMSLYILNPNSLFLKEGNKSLIIISLCCVQIKKVGEEDKLSTVIKYLRVRAQILSLIRICVLIRFHLNLSSKSDFLSTLQNPLKMRDHRSQQGTEQWKKNKACKKD